jgi:hypothetical protein
LFKFQALTMTVIFYGAFFPQSYFKMPEEKVSQHRC